MNQKSYHEQLSSLEGYTPLSPSPECFNDFLFRVIRCEYSKIALVCELPDSLPYPTLRLTDFGREAMHGRAEVLLDFAESQEMESREMESQEI